VFTTEYKKKKKLHH